MHAYEYIVSVIAYHSDGNVNSSCLSDTIMQQEVNVRKFTTILYHRRMI